MYVIGITGGVGSGKTVAAHELAKIANAQVILTDELAHLAMEKDSKGYDQIVACFGKELLNDQKEIDRKQLANIVFRDEKMLEKLNQIIHPIVMDYLREQIERRKKEEGYLILENAIMFESGCDKLCDEIWYVYVPDEIRIKRLQTSRGYSKEKSISIMKKQLSIEEFKTRCDKIIKNTGNLAELENELEIALKK